MSEDYHSYLVGRVVVDGVEMFAEPIDEGPVTTVRPEDFMPLTSDDIRAMNANVTEEATPYVSQGFSSRVDWYSDGSVWIDGVRVRETWWRRALNWLWRAFR